MLPLRATPPGNGRITPATTNDAFCPTLRAVTSTALPDGVNAVLEIVLDGLDAAAITSATRAGIRAACRDGVHSITAGNYGGKLGKYQFHLRKLLEAEGTGDWRQGTGKA